jgi:hypothetical protein
MSSPRKAPETVEQLKAEMFNLYRKNAALVEDNESLRNMLVELEAKVAAQDAELAPLKSKLEKEHLRNAAKTLYNKLKNAIQSMEIDQQTVLLDAIATQAGLGLNNDDGKPKIIHAAWHKLMDLCRAAHNNPGLTNALQTLIDGNSVGTMLSNIDIMTALSEKKVSKKRKTAKMADQADDAQDDDDQPDDQADPEATDEDDAPAPVVTKKQKKASSGGSAVLEALGIAEVATKKKISPPSMIN